MITRNSRNHSLIKPNPKEAKVTNQFIQMKALAFTNGNLVDRCLTGKYGSKPVQYDLREPVQDQKQNQFKNLRNARKGVNNCVLGELKGASAKTGPFLFC
jgi:hypothetical protein